MTTQTPEEPGSYLRGGAVTTDARRAAQLVLWFCYAVLVVLVVVFAAQAVREHNGSNRLQSHGTVVSVTATTCIGQASGTGITEYRYQCKGTFSLAGRSYDEVIHGSSGLLTPGTVVRAVVDPRDPTSLTTATAVAKPQPLWQALLPSVISLLLLLGLFGGVAWRRQTRAGRADDTA